MISLPSFRALIESIKTRFDQVEEEITDKISTVESDSLDVEKNTDTVEVEVKEQAYNSAVTQEDGLFDVKLLDGRGLGKTSSGGFLYVDAHSTVTTSNKLATMADLETDGLIYYTTVEFGLWSGSMVQVGQPELSYYDFMTNTRYISVADPDNPGTYIWVVDPDFTTPLTDNCYMDVTLYVVGYDDPVMGTNNSGGRAIYDDEWLMNVDPPRIISVRSDSLDVYTNIINQTSVDLKTQDAGSSITQSDGLFDTKILANRGIIKDNNGNLYIDANTPTSSTNKVASMADVNAAGVAIDNVTIKENTENQLYVDTNTAATTTNKIATMADLSEDTGITDIHSDTLDAVVNGDYATIDIKEQVSGSSVREENGLFDVKLLDNRGIVSNGSGYLYVDAHTTLSSNNKVASMADIPTDLGIDDIESDSLDIDISGRNAEIEIRTQATGSSISESDGLFDVKIASSRGLIKDANGNLIVDANTATSSTNKVATMADVSSGGSGISELDSTTLDVSVDGSEGTMDIKTQPSTSSITQTNGLFDTKILANRGIVKDTNGNLYIDSNTATSSTNKVATMQDIPSVEVDIDNVTIKENTDGELYVDTNTAATTTNKIATMADISGGGFGTVTNVSSPQFEVDFPTTTPIIEIPPFSPDTAYTAGKMVFNGRGVYYALTAVSGGEFNPSQWQFIGYTNIQTSTLNIESNELDPSDISLDLKDQATDSSITQTNGLFDTKILSNRGIAKDTNGNLYIDSQTPTSATNKVATMADVNSGGTGIGDITSNTLNVDIDESAADIELKDPGDSSVIGIDQEGIIDLKWKGGDGFKQLADGGYLAADTQTQTTATNKIATMWDVNESVPSFDDITIKENTDGEWYVDTQTAATTNNKIATMADIPANRINNIQLGSDVTALAEIIGNRAILPCANYLHTGFIDGNLDTIQDGNTIPGGTQIVFPQAGWEQDTSSNVINYIFPNNLSLNVEISANSLPKRFTIHYGGMDQFTYTGGVAGDWTGTGFSFNATTNTLTISNNIQLIQKLVWVDDGVSNPFTWFSWTGNRINTGLIHQIQSSTISINDGQLNDIIIVTPTPDTPQLIMRGDQRANFTLYEINESGAENEVTLTYNSTNNMTYGPNQLDPGPNDNPYKYWMLYNTNDELLKKWYAYTESSEVTHPMLHESHYQDGTFNFQVRGDVSSNWYLYTIRSSDNSAVQYNGTYLSGANLTQYDNNVSGANVLNYVLTPQAGISTYSDINEAVMIKKWHPIM